MKIKKEVHDLNDEIIRLRRDFHMHPELGYEENRTSKIVADYLESLGLKVKRGIAKTGVVGLLKGTQKGPTILLRADMDALPIQDEKKVSYKSTVEGKMHACGHDGHTAMLLVAARVLSRRKSEIKGNIKFVFQPNEEGGGGSKVMMDEGIMEDPHVDAAYAIHLWSQLESNKIAITSGPVMAATTHFELSIKGEGGHTSSPQLSVDPIITAAHIISTTQIIQTREVDVLGPFQIIFGKIHGGTSFNTIPNEVNLEGSIRYLYEGGKRDRKKFERVIKGICDSHRAKYELNYVYHDHMVNNDIKMTRLVETVARKMITNENVVITDFRVMGGEDFAHISRVVPSTFYFIGVGNKQKKTDYAHHHPCFDIDEDALSVGVEMHVRTALAYLNSSNQ